MTVADTLLELLRIESITGNEKQICDFVEDLIQARFTGTKPLHTIERTGDSVVVFGEARPDRKTICLAGHLDTVPGTEFGDKAQRIGDRIHGLGASDMKGGVAVMLELCRPEVFDRSGYNIIQIYYAGEEGTKSENELNCILENFPRLSSIDLCFVLEPTDNLVHLGCMGSLTSRVIFTGTAAHSARPWMGENAIHKAAPFLARLRSETPRSIIIENLEFKEVISATMAQGGKATNVIPDRFEIAINARFAPNADGSEMQSKLLSLLNNEGRVELVGIFPSCPPPPKNGIYSKFQERFKIRELAKQAYTDVALFAQYGISALNLGPD